MPECPECGHRWSSFREKDLLHATRRTEDGWRSLTILFLPRYRPPTGWMCDGLIWRRSFFFGPIVVHWLRFDLANHTPEELSVTMYQRTGFLTKEKREELGE